MRTIILEDNQVLENKFYDGLDDKLEDDVLIYVKGDNVVLNTLRFDHYRGKKDCLIKITGKNCIIKKCIFNEVDGDFVFISSDYDVVIRNCLFFNINSKNKLLVLNGTHNCIVKNRFDNVSSKVLIEMNNDDNLIVDNKILNCNGDIVLNGKNTIVSVNTIDSKSSGTTKISVYNQEHILTNNKFFNLIKSGIVLNCGENNDTAIKQCVIGANHFVKCNSAFSLGYKTEKNKLKPTDIIFENNTFENVSNIFSIDKGNIGIRNYSSYHNRYMTSDMGKHLGITRGFNYTTTIMKIPIELKEFTDYLHYRDYILKTDDKEMNLEREEKEEDEEEDIVLREDTYEMKVLNKMMNHLKVQYKMERFEELKVLIEKNQKEMKELLNEMTRIYKL